MKPFDSFRDSFDFNELAVCSQSEVVSKFIIVIFASLTKLLNLIIVFSFPAYMCLAIETCVQFHLMPNWTCVKFICMRRGRSRREAVGPVGRGQGSGKKMNPLLLQKETRSIKFVQLHPCAAFTSVTGQYTEESF